jgi:peptidoglycan/LPS O-acetylase OafA/YrhL
VSPFWSLSYVVWFYIWLLALAAILQKRWWGFPLFVLCCFVYTRMNAAYLLVWLLGGASYMCRPKTFNKWLFLLSWVIIVVGVACCQMTTETKFAGGIQLGIDGFVFRVLLCVGMCLLAQQLILLPPKGRIMQKFESVFSRLADFSYTLYLTHRITLLVIFTFFFEKYKADMSPMNKLFYLGIISVCLLVAYILYWVAERHTKTVKKYIKAHLM